MVLIATILAQVEVNLALSVPLLLVGFAALYYGAEWLVEGAVAIATHLKISKVVAGVILVAFGTSAPELFVNSIAASRGEAGFALSNISGSNLANLLIGFGLCAIISGVVVREKLFRLDLVTFALAPLLIFIIMLMSPGDSYILPVWSAILLSIVFGIYLWFTKDRIDTDEDDSEAELTLGMGFVYFAIGIGGLYLGGEITVRQATQIAAGLGVPDAILGLTIVALGTSIPDITASVVAARQNETSIAVGNLLGSNIFNVLFVLPMTLLFSRQALSAEWAVVSSYAVVAVISALFFVWVRFNAQLSRASGIALLIVYALYIGFRIVTL